MTEAALVERSGAVGEAGRDEFACLTFPAGRRGAVFSFSGSRGSVMRRGHWHTEWEINLVVRGRAVYAAAGERVELQRGSLLWLLPSQAHVLLEHSSSLEMYIVVVDPALLMGLVDSSAFEPWQGWLSGQSVPTRVLHRVLSERASSALAGLCGALRQGFRGEVEAEGRGAGHYEAGLVWLAAEAWRTYTQASDRPAASHLHPAVEAAVDWLDRHAHEPEADDLDALARRCHVSRPHLSRLFHRQTGQTLTAFRTGRRVQRFLGLIEGQAVRSMTEAAYAAGFGSYAQAFRSVKAATGQGPREHLRRETLA
ncbi:MAG: AraC family transcriptional regulator [Planctomycetota bacterium]